MTTSKSNKKAAQKPQMTKAQQEALRQQIKQISEVTPEELVGLLRKEPKGQLAMNVTLDALWPKFKETFQIMMPKRTPGMTQHQYEKSLESYRNWTNRIKGIARFWYLCGTVHQQNIEEIISVLDSKQEDKAPEAPEK